MYLRVIPRDLFNEANLLKCIGKIYINLETTPGTDAKLVHDDQAFCIDQNESTGGIYVRNVQLLVRGERYEMERPLNSREPWPLYITTGDDEEISVFNDHGDFSKQMGEFLSGVSDRSEPTRENQMWHARKLAAEKGRAALLNPHAYTGKECRCGECFCCAAFTVAIEKGWM